MRLTRKKAISISIELWTWLAETGSEYKSLWSGWLEYGHMLAHCPLCEYGRRREDKGGKTTCSYCPYRKKHGGCYSSRDNYARWLVAETSQQRKLHAKAFLAQLEELES
ncbi:MAG: hypothetical protein V3S51_07240 [Dehalococcoidia bacterium]